MSPFDPRVIVAGFAPVLLCGGMVRAQAPAPPVESLPEESVAAESELGRDENRAGVFAGAAWSSCAGSEVEAVDPAPSFEGGIFWRVLGGLSVWGSAAFAKHDVSAQLMELLDQPLRPDRRSGNVQGEVRLRRMRAGVRLDAAREPGWRYTPYVVGAVSFSKVEVAIDSIDGNPDPPPVLNPDGELKEVSSLEDSSLGAFGRVGLEYGLTTGVRLDFHGSFEVTKFPAGTNSSAMGGAGVVYRF